MKKCIRNLGLIMLAMLLVLSTTVFATFAADGIKVKINGEPVEFDVPPQLINDRTMVPLRAIFEALGAKVEWNGDTQTVTATRGDIVVVSTIGNKIMYVSGEAKTMDVAPVIISDRTLVPARFVAEAFGCFVEWESSTRTVYIDYTVDDEDDESVDWSDLFTEEDLNELFQ